MTAHNSRIEHSHPIDKSEIQETLMDIVLKDKQSQNMALDEDLRKKKRVDRLKQMGVTGKFDSTIFSNANASDWEKLEQLKQVQLIRATHK